LSAGGGGECSSSDNGLKADGDRDFLSNLTSTLRFLFFFGVVRSESRRLGQDLAVDTVNGEGKRVFLGDRVEGGEIMLFWVIL
jgi:hypothetical protein